MSNGTEMDSNWLKTDEKWTWIETDKKRTSPHRTSDCHKPSWIRADDTSGKILHSDLDSDTWTLTPRDRRRATTDDGTHYGLVHG
jgi:hypothetical protein